MQCQQTLIKYIDRFEIAGIDELRNLHASAMSDLESTRESLRLLQAVLQDPKVSNDEKSNVRTQLAYMESSLAQIDSEWHKIFAENDYCKSEISQLLDLRPNLNSMRLRAEAQLKLLENISFLQLVKNSIGSFQAAFSSLTNIRLVPLDTERVKRLLNIG